ncbi:MAG: DUF4037 domain-containing protein [Candidatus Heimdallarchaeota archaeon]|nr:DUF4037 domain-containing protein [Candidatus Heimdallarchaeota archaeon]
MERQSISGIDLSERFFYEVVKSVIDTEFPELKYGAALIGPGSEVMGLDDEISKDHDWGLKLYIFVEESRYDSIKQTMNDMFRERLPYDFLGHSTNWVFNEDKTMRPELISEGEVNHRIKIYSVKSFLKEYLDIETLELSEKDWLLLPEQRLLEFTSGKIFFNTLGELTVARSKLQYFPDNVWKYKILSQWNRISQEIAFVGRTRMLGDELGTRIETSRLVRMLIEMLFILKRRYIPYPKWLTVIFQQLPIAKTIYPFLLGILNETENEIIENSLCDAYLMILEEQNKLQITGEIEGKIKPFFSRPQMIINVDDIIEELKKIIEPPLKDLKQIGSIDQFIDCTDITCNSNFIKNAKGFFD